MSSLPSEAEASKILDDERSGQAVMEDFLEGQADALGFIDPESDDDAPDASLQNDAAALMAAPTREGIDGPAAAPTAAEAEDVVDHEARAALLERLLEASQKDLRAAVAKVDSANRRAQGFRALLADAKSRHSRQEQELAELRASKNLACELLAAVRRQLGAEQFARVTTSNRRAMRTRAPAPAPAPHSPLTTPTKQTPRENVEKRQAKASPARDGGPVHLE